MRPSAIAVAFDLDDAFFPPLIVRTAVALENESPIVFELSDPASYRAFAALWEESSAPPYLVFEDAQAALEHWHPLGLNPPRFGCLKTAATLLAAGADGHRDQRELSESVRRHLGVELPPPLPSIEATRSSLAARSAQLLPLLKHYTPQLRRQRLARLFEFECKLLHSVVAMQAQGFALDGGAFERVALEWSKERESQDLTPQRAARLDKLLSTYRWWARDYLDPDGRIRCRLHPLATDSGRFSCSDPNLQQVPSEQTAPGLRSCFRAPPGRKLILADYAQIELRVAAHLAPCDALRSVFTAGRDPHRATAATITGKNESVITPRERQLAKAVNFGFLFGMGSRRFREYARSSFGVELDEAESSRAREAFFDTFPGIAAWHRRTSHAQRQSESLTVYTAMGRQKRFEAGQISFNTALNIPVQGTAAEGFKLAMSRLEPALRKLDAYGVLCVHDEYIAEAPEDRAEEAAACIEKLMCESMRELVPSVPIEVEVKLASDWGEK